MLGMVLLAATPQLQYKIHEGAAKERNGEKLGSDSAKQAYAILVSKGQLK